MDVEKNILRGPESMVKLSPNLSMGQFMFDRLSGFGDRVASINAETKEQITYQEILEQSVQLAVYLSNEGLKKDDRIAICSENCLNFMIPICSAMYLGVASCPLNPNYSKREFVHALNISKPKIVFVSASSANKLRNIIKDLPWPLSLISIGETFSGVPRMKDLIKKNPLPDLATFKACEVDVPQHVLAILCSSGTTGLPKGVMLTDENFITITCQMIETIMTVPSGSFADDVLTLKFLPFFHAYAFVSLVTQVALGVTSVILSRFDPEKFLSTIQEYKIEQLMLVPPLMVFLAKSPLVDRYDLSSIKQIWCGAAPLSENIRHAVSQRLNKPVIKQGYGLTETTLGVLKSPHTGDKPGSVGQLNPDTFGKVISVDENASNEPLGPYQEGELCFKGPLIMKGYCGDEKATSAAIDKDGWLHTGDIGYYDSDGYFYIVDRIKELIKYKGFQVPPAELEGIMLTHPDIVDCAVIGIPDEACGELPLGFVVKKPQSKLTTAEVVKFVNDQVSHQKWLRGGVRFIDAIPKTASGKILRRLLRDKLKSKL
ncbi:luciferin 4-monooxygenase [Venturia canescens]|uniref:luciferin 4-monooxygenase n=1 Tax=Venturia canescens TaxID=32260 RepID=UPI001C9BF98A|nr:luciferin 4-monooxygenase [Venturia canescens]